MPSGVVHTLKGHGLCTAKTWTECQRVLQIDHPQLLALVSLGTWCKVTVAEALSHHTWLLILQWELDPMSSRLDEVLRQCPGTGRYEKLICRAGADRCLTEHPWYSSQAQPALEALQMAAPNSLVKLLTPALSSGWTSIQKQTNASRAVKTRC